MLESANHFVGYGIQATDGDIGRVDDFYFDDKSWTVRYLVVDTGKWLPGKLVLISPASVERLEAGRDRIPVRLTRAQIENSPPIEKDMPVSRQKEMELSKYYRWPEYWTATDQGDAGPYWPIPPVPSGPTHLAGKPETAVMDGDPHLRSVRAVVGYSIHATDARIGRVYDFIIDDDAWIIRYLAVNTGTWLPRRKVLIPPAWIQEIHWEKWTVHVNLDRERIRRSPLYDPGLPISREYEQALYDYYGRPKYWIRDEEGQE